MKTFDPQTTLELEAAVFRRLVEHLRSRTDVQNIDMMNLAGFCRNCLSAGLPMRPRTKGWSSPRTSRARSFTACRIRNGKPAPPEEKQNAEQQDAHLPEKPPPSGALRRKSFCGIYNVKAFTRNIPWIALHVALLRVASAGSVGRSS